MLGGDRALWTADFGYGNTESTNSFRTASARDRRARVIDHGYFTTDGSEPLGAPATAGGAGSVLFYTESCDESCNPTVKRVVGRKAVGLFKPRGPGRTIGLAKSKVRIALIKSVYDGAGTISDLTWVELRSRKGSLLRRFRSRGQPRAVALAQDYVALLTFSANKESVRVFDVRTGAARAVVPVPKNDAAGRDEIAASGHWVAFATRNKIFLLNTATKSVSAAVTTRTLPIGLSISGRRLAWAELSAHGSRIRAITLRP